MNGFTGRFNRNDNLTRLLLVGGGLFLLARLMRGIGGAFWAVFGIAAGLFWATRFAF